MSPSSSPFARTLRLSLGAALAFAAFSYAYHLIGGDLRALVHPSGALIVAGGPVALLGSTRSLQRLANATLAAGVIGVVMGLVHVMTHLDQPSTVGIGVAVSLVAMLYALGSTFILGSAGLSQAAHRQSRVPDLTPYALMAVTFLLLLAFAVLYAIRQ